MTNVPCKYKMSIIEETAWGRGSRRNMVLWKIPVLSSQLLCKSKTILKLRLFLKNYTYTATSAKI
jgi:hypothetical protein